MTSLFDVIAADENDERVAYRKAAVVAQVRADKIYGEWIRHDPSRLAHVEDEIRAIAAQAAEEFGVKNATTIADVVLGAGWTKKKDDDDNDDDADDHGGKSDHDEDDEDDDKKTSSVHESRKPRMCPFHKDVVDISLNAGDPTAGYTAMSQHWGGPRHCEGNEYEGAKCNFKPQMTTQSYWDERAEKAEQRRLERQEQAELEAQQPTEEIEEPILLDETPEVDEGAEVINFPSNEPSAIGEGYEGDEVGPEPIAVAAKVADDKGAYKCARCEDGVHCGDCSCCRKGGPTEAKVANNGLCKNCGKPLGNDTGTYCKSCGEEKESSLKESEYKYVKKQGDKWVIIQKGTGKVLSTHDSEEKAKSAFRAMEMNMHGGSTKTADDGLGGKGEPSPKIDKRLWTPKTVPVIDELDKLNEPVEYEKHQAPWNGNDLKQIGDAKREKLPTSDNAGFSSGGEDFGPHTDTWNTNKGQADPVTAAAEDPEKNPIVEIVENGFLPEDEIQEAINGHPL